MTLAPEASRRLAAQAGARDAPVAPVRPPGAGLLLGAGQPRVSARRVFPRDEVLRLGSGRWRHDALYVAAPTAHELALPPERLRRRVARFPRDDVVGEAGEDVGVAGDLR